MNIILDASSLINLINGEALASILVMPDDSYFVGHIVIDECNGDAISEAAVAGAIAGGFIQVVDDSNISSSQFSYFAQAYGLGDGETECMALSSELGFVVATDDRLARGAVQTEFGPDRLTGSLGLLRRACEAEILSTAEAWSMYGRMIDAGGFLPQIPIDFFETS